MSCVLSYVDSALSDQTGPYRLLAAVGTDHGRAVGYICYGPIPLTEGSWDLHWIATDAKVRGQGIGGALCAAMETEVQKQGGRLVRVEGSPTDGYGAAHRFYERRGYAEVCRVPDFYEPGDDLILMFKKLT